MIGARELMATTVDYVLDEYRKIIHARHPLREGAWPVLSGYNVTIGTMGQLVAHIFKHTGNDGFVSSNGIGEIDPAVSGVTSINHLNLETVRDNLARHFRAGLEDAVVFVHAIPNGESYKVGLPTGELERLARQHEAYMGLSPMKIFLSHKSADKTLLRNFAKTLEALGFQPWLDEDAMHAGVNLERGLLSAFEQSCAVVFFITENFVDRDYLATEIDYAIRQKRTKDDKFSIITLCFARNGKKVTVPELLKTYVYKEPSTDLEALREVLRALPIKVGDIRWK
jgi:hypothetical protein